MDIEISSVYLTKESVFIEGTDVSEEQYARQSRERYDEERVIRFEFDQTDPKAIEYLRRWLKRQKRVRDLMKIGKPSWGDVLLTVVGTDTQLSGRYLIREY